MQIRVIIADVQTKVIIPDYSSQHLGNKCIHLSVSYGLKQCVQVCSSSHALVRPGSKIPGQACSTTSICLMSMRLIMIAKVLLEITHFSKAIKQTHLKSRYGGRHSNLFKLGCQGKASKGCQPHEPTFLCLHSPAGSQARLNCTSHSLLCRCWAAIYTRLKHNLHHHRLHIPS